MGMHNDVHLYIECSKGTYIRSIANDLGEVLGTYGYLTKLVRTKAGLFELEDSTKLEDLNSIQEVEKHLIYPTDYLSYEKYGPVGPEKEELDGQVYFET